MTRLLSAIVFLQLLAAPVHARVWRVENDAALAAAVSESAPGDTIELVASGTPYRTSVLLKKDQSLLGSGNPVLAAGAQPAIVVTAPNVTIDGIAVEVPGEGDGIALQDVSGGFHARNATIQGSGSGAAVRITGGEGEAAFERVAITRTKGAAVVIRRRKGGAIAFRGGSTITVSGGKADAIAIEDAGGSVTFADAITVATTGARALFAKGVGTLTISGAPASFTSTNAAAVEIRGAALEATLTKVSSAGTSTGYLDTGAIVEHVTGRLLIAGGEIRGTKMRGIEIRHSSNISIRDFVLGANAETNGTASGNCLPLEGTEVRCNAALVLEHVDGISLRDVRIDGSGQMGVSGSDVRNLTFERVFAAAAGNELNEHAMAFRELAGEARFVECTFQRPASRGLDVLNHTGEANISIEKSVFTAGTPPNAQQPLFVSAGGRAKLALRIADSTFTDSSMFAVHVVAGGESKVEATVRGSRFDRTGGIVIIGEQNGSVTFDVRANRLTEGTIAPVTVTLIGTANAAGTIAGNTITGASCNACGGINVEAQVQASLRAAIANNTLSQIDGYPLRVQAGGRPADTATVCVDIRDNKIPSPIQLVNRTSASHLLLAGYKGKGNDVAAISAFLQARTASPANVRMSQTPAENAVAGCEETK